MQAVLGDSAEPLKDLAEVLLQVVIYGTPAELPSLNLTDNHTLLRVLDHTLCEAEVSGSVSHSQALGSLGTQLSGMDGIEI